MTKFLLQSNGLIMKNDDKIEKYFEDGYEIHKFSKYLIYYKNKKIHRDIGPAIIYDDGEVRYCMNGKLHRLIGPAVIREIGRHFWFINGHDVTYEINQWAKEMEIDLKNLTEDDVILIQIKWSEYNG